MMDKTLERELIAVIRKHARTSPQTATTPEGEAATIMATAWETMRDVLADAQRLEALISTSPRLTAALLSDPAAPLAGDVQIGDLQDAAAVWTSFRVWMGTPLDVGGRQVSPVQAIQRRERVYGGDAVDR